MTGRISEDPDAGPLTGLEKIPCVDNGVNVTTTPDRIADYIRADPIWPGDMTVTGGIEVAGGWLEITDPVNASFDLCNSAAPSDAKIWDMYADTVGTLRFRATRDDVSAANTWCTVTRTGYTITSIAFTNAPVTSSGSVKAMAGTAVPAGGTTGSGLLMSSASNLGVFFGSGLPTLAAAKGSLYLRTDGSSTSTRLYVNTDGSTGWTNVTTAT